MALRADESPYGRARIDVGLAVERVGEATDPDATVRFRDRDAPAGEHPYWVRVRQADGEMAWSSPSFVTVA